jgi:hypothetical protein
MKKILLISFIGFIFTTAGAYAGCGSCGGDAGHDHAAKAECSAEKKAECAAEKKCCGTDGKCCHKKCAEDCDKPCCAKEKKADETAATKAAGGCCPVSKDGKPA